MTSRKQTFVSSDSVAVVVIHLGALTSLFSLQTRFPCLEIYGSAMAPSLSFASLPF